jgi:hypothetical protein
MNGRTHFSHVRTHSWKYDQTVCSHISYHNRGCIIGHSFHIFHTKILVSSLCAVIFLYYNTLPVNVLYLHTSKTKTVHLHVVKLCSRPVKVLIFKVFEFRERISSIKAYKIKKKHMLQFRIARKCQVVTVAKIINNRQKRNEKRGEKNKRKNQ